MRICFFQSTPPRRRRPLFISFNCSNISIFNPRLREGGDSSCKKARILLCIFQSTPPRRRRPLSFSIAAPERVFNPRLREGGDTVVIINLDRFRFSIHASAKEATKMAEEYKKEIIFSIHASAKEATWPLLLRWYSLSDFQSTPPRRRRH